MRLRPQSIMHGREAHFGKSVLSLIGALVLALSLVPAMSWGEESGEHGDPSLEENADLSIEETLEPEHEPGELIVVYENEIPGIDEVIVTDEGESTTLQGEGVREQQQLADIPSGGTAVLVSLEDSSEESMVQAMEALSSMEGVACVEPNYSYSVAVNPNDEHYSKQYYLKNCNFPAAWDGSIADGKVTVAVVDTGCNLEHSDLKDIVDKSHAYDAVSKKPLAASGVENNGDLQGHGTNVCGVVGAQANNVFGIAGASWNAQILPVRIFDNYGNSNSNYLIRALDYLDGLIENGSVDNLRVINMSIGGDGNNSIVKQCLDHLYSKHGILNVAAGGNGENGKPITSYTYPSDYNSCIGVTSTTQSGAQSSWCDYNDAKDIAAPGERIWSTTLNGSYGDYESGYGGYISGTSFSAPIVSGAAAIMFAKYPNASPYDVVSAMQKTAKTVVNKPTTSGSAGQLDAAAALNYLASHVTGLVPSSIGSVPSISNGIQMYRLYNPYTSEHFYTANAGERDWLTRSHGWMDEGVGWVAPKSGQPVYRLYNEGIGDHHYTMSKTERDWLVRSQGWTDEGIGWYSGGTMPVYRQYNGGLKHGQHNYTKSKAENDWLCSSQGWTAEGIGWYGLG